MNAGDFEQLRATIIELVPPESRKFIESRLTYANEISLRKRMRRMIEPFGDLFGSSSETRALVRDIVDMRNYLTHYDRKLESRARSINDNRMYGICLRLDALFHLHFLRLTGMDTDRIRSMARENRVLRHQLALDE